MVWWILRALPPSCGLFFQDDGLEALVRQVEGRVDAGEAAADDQGPLVDGQGLLLQGLEQRGPGHRHPHQVLGLLRGLLVSFMCTQEYWLRILAISKRYLLRPASIDGLPEQGLVGAGRAGGHHHPVEACVPR